MNRKRLTRILKSRGPRIDPSETPPLAIAQSLNEEPIFVLCIRKPK